MYIDKEYYNDIVFENYTFLKYYNNNYRPITHVELFFFKIIKIIKDKEEKNKEVNNKEVNNKEVNNI